MAGCAGEEHPGSWTTTLSVLSQGHKKKEEQVWKEEYVFDVLKLGIYEGYARAQGKFPEPQS